MKERTLAASAEKGSEKKESIIWEYVKSILIALILAMIIRTFVVQPFLIPSGSMEQTLMVGDRILVNKFLYGTSIPFTHIRVLKVREPLRGDVVVFVYPMDPSKDFVKRVIGVPGDRIRIVDKQVHVNGELYANPHARHTGGGTIPGALSHRDNMDEITVPADSCFVMGDNRDNSYDSRFWGFVKRESIKGKAFVKYWSWDADHWKVRWRNIGALIQ